ncbi:MAG: hypothetical protein EBT12_02315 [Marivivens sp.]|nr:hypothetical protein [Marivivens sp.]
MKSNVFANELTKTSTIFGRKETVNVVFQGDGALTDGQTIKLPALDLTGEVTEEQAAIMRGYVDHEAGHVRHTDFDVLKRNKHKLVGNKLLHSCANALEDIWLEKRVISEYGGAEKNIRATSDAVNKDFLRNVKRTDPRLQDPVFIGPVAATWIGREGYGGETQKKCIDMIDKDMEALLRSYVDRLDGCDSSSDVFALAEQMEADLRRERDERKEPEEGEGKHEREGEEGEEGETGTPDSEMGDGERTGHGDDVDGTDKPEGRDVREGEKPDDGDRDVTSEGSERGPDMDDVYEDFGLEKVLEKLAKEIRGERGDRYTPFSTAFDMWFHRTDEKHKYPGNEHSNKGYHILGKGSADVYDNVLSEMSGTINMLRRKLERALIAKQTRDWDVAKEHGRLDTKRLTAAVAGRTTVFKQRTDRMEMDTAVTLLVDLSGSMCGSRIEVARQCAIAIAEAVDRTGIKYEILGFDNQWSSQWCDEYRGQFVAGDGIAFNRQEPLRMAVFKHFDERLFEAKGAIGAMVGMADGNNADGEALLHAFNRLNARPDKRKVMIRKDYGFWIAVSKRVRERGVRHADLSTIRSICEEINSEYILPRR